MEIDVFYQNDDMAFGFTGSETPLGFTDSSIPKGDDYAFAKKAEYGFEDVDYSYATGREAEVEKWWVLTTEDKKDCKIIASKISGLERVIATEEKNMSTYKGGDKRVKQEYLNLYKKRLDFFKSAYEDAGCELAKTEKEESEFNKLLEGFTSNADTSKTGNYALIIGGVLVVGVVGFLLYKKYKK